VMVFNTSSVSNGMNASYVLGQSGFGGGSANQGGSIGRATMNDPIGLAFDAANERLFVLDGENDRVLVFNVAPGVIANGENASYGLGEPDFVTSVCNNNPPTQNGLCTGGYIGIGGVSYDPNNGRLFVADGFNYRVLVFDVAPGVIANGENASYVLGQSNFITATGQTPSASEFVGGPSYVYYDPGSGRVFVTDLNGNRVLIFEGSFMGNSRWTPGYD
jgi:DNA-binding beta-propeller fold protein YncE